MIEIQRILCPIDFSETSRHALDHAVAIATWYGSRVTVFHASSNVPAAVYAPAATAATSTVLTPADRKQLLEGMKRFAETESGSTVPIDFDIREGNVAAEIVAKASADRADLIVIGTHGRSGFERLILGSVAEKVLRMASCPVLSVPPQVADAVPAVPGRFKRPICTIDFSDCSLGALEFAVSLAEEADAHLTVLNVLEIPPEYPPYATTDSPVGSQSLASYVAAETETRQARLETVVPETAKNYSTIDTRLETGTAYREILRVADAEQCDLIVMGVRGRGPVDRWFFGSTAQHIVRQAKCPVLTIQSTV